MLQVPLSALFSAKGSASSCLLRSSKSLSLGFAPSHIYNSGTFPPQTLFSHHIVNGVTLQVFTMNSSSTNPLNPTYVGHIASTLDAIVLFEACLSGTLNHVPRRPHDRERQELICSGNVFIYEEHASGIKRWTDGVSWSPSRILGNFLIYRELKEPFPPGEKKRALKKNRKVQVQTPTPKSEPGVRVATSDGNLDPNAAGNSADRALIGSLVDSYPFKPDGLVKKTISICYQGVPHHLVSYYNVDDVIANKLVAPSEDQHLRNVIPRTELVMQQNFRTPLEDTGDSRLAGMLRPQGTDYHLDHGINYRPGTFQGYQPLPAYIPATPTTYTYTPAPLTQHHHQHQPNPNAYVAYNMAQQGDYTSLSSDYTASQYTAAPPYNWTQY